MLYNMCHVMLYFMVHVMLYNVCHVMLYNICSEQNRTCYITYVMLYVTYAMLCCVTYVQNRTEQKMCYVI